MASSVVHRVLVLSAASAGIVAASDTESKPDRLTPSLKQTLAEADTYKKVDVLGLKEPRVQLSGKKWRLDWDSVWTSTAEGSFLGLGAWFDSDIFVSFGSPFYQMTRN